MSETKTRTLVRSITYRIIAVLLTILFTYILTGDVSSSTGYALALHFILSLAFYIHERVWLRITWGSNE